MNFYAIFIFSYFTRFMFLHFISFPLVFYFLNFLVLLNFDVTDVVEINRRFAKIELGVPVVGITQLFISFRTVRSVLSSYLEVT